MTQLVRNGLRKQAVKLGSLILGWQVAPHLEWNVGDRSFLTQGGPTMAEDFTQVVAWECVLVKGNSFACLKI